VVSSNESNAYEPKYPAALKVFKVFWIFFFTVVHIVFWIGVLITHGNQSDQPMFFAFMSFVMLIGQVFFVSHFWGSVRETANLSLSKRDY
jgi:hypothetical protein